MSKQILPFEFGGEQIRVELIDGDPWFVAQDVAKVLEYSATSAMARRIDAEDKGVRDLHTPGGMQPFTVISEAGLYAAIFGSQAPGAHAFKRLVTHEILPTIRRTGSYSVAPAPVELDRRALALMVIEAEDARVAAFERAVVAEARAEATQKILDNVEIKDGLVVRDWIGRYFLPRQENRIWELFYAKSLLKDGRGKGGTDRHGKPKSSRDHQRVYTEGFPFFIRTKKEFQVGDGVTRYETRVRPGRAELELVSYCEKHGIMPLPEVSQALKEISELSDVAGPLRAVAA